MAFKNFRISVLVRVTALTATLSAFMYLTFETEFIASAIVVGIMAVVQIWSLITYVEKTNSELARFLRSIRYDDFSQGFSAKGKGPSFEDLGLAFSEIMTRFRQTRSEAEEQHQYLQTVVQHIGIGLMAYTGTGRIQLINTAAKRILNITHLPTLLALEPVSKNLVATLRSMKAGDKALVKIDRNNELVQLAVYATEFRLREQNFTLVSLQNIRAELEEKEMEAYQKLIRVLTHEIMNSVTPISSLASTVRDVLEQAFTRQSGLEREALQDMRGAVQTIEKRSEGLLHFVEAYRNLTRIPKPKFKIVRISELFEGVERLMKVQLPAGSTRLATLIEPPGLELTADPELIEQVIINLVLNAIHAVKSVENGRIRMTARMDKMGHVVIDVADNGHGIAEEAKDKIFVPFFTTKQDGSGIGLSLSKEIMRLHRGSIHLFSNPGEDTVFRLVF
jgi:nitrogen fixation/metabolism regulation signal transduction histidine kinase